MPAPDKGALGVSHKSQMVPTVTSLISRTKRDTQSVCVCVCVCVRERERDRERQSGRTAV